MAFDIILQRNGSEKNRLDKTLTTIATMTGTLKNETSIIDPVIIVECTIADIRTSNYMTIGNFGRSYFIEGIRSIRTGIVEITGHVDVLSSFKGQIRANSAIIHKQEKDWNLYLNDASLKVYQDPEVTTHLFSGAGFNTMEFVLAVAGS